MGRTLEHSHLLRPIACMQKATDVERLVLDVDALFTVPSALKARKANIMMRREML